MLIAASANVGDTTPNTLGAFCESPGEAWDGLACDFNSSTCGGTVQDCHGRGPGFRISDYESNRLIGTYQYQGAKTIMGSSLKTVAGPVKSVHVYMNMTYRPFTLANGTTVTTCPPAMGFSFAGGTTDGPGAFDFIQGETSDNVTNPLWAIVGDIVTAPPPKEQVACQYPKPVLLNTGYAHTPYEWQPDTVDIQMLRVGQLVMLIAPGELTTMAGRRLRNAVRTALIAQGVIDNSAYVVIAGPANTYAHYVTTREEYAVQRYEGASTIFGQFTLEAYMDRYSGLVKYLNPSTTGTPTSDAAPAEQTSKALSLRVSWPHASYSS
jgi:neutral ceramidase